MNSITLMMKRISKTLTVSKIDRDMFRFTGLDIEIYED